MKTTLCWLLLVLLLTASLAACGGDDGGSASPEPGEEDGFSLSTAVTLMQLCLESYQMLTDFENGDPFSLPSPFVLQAQFDTEEHFTGEGLNGMVPIAFVATSGSSIYVVFRGTKTISEWIADATVPQVDYPYASGAGMTEEGFTGVYETIRTPILQEVNRLVSGGGYSSLYVTGHSLGGALAVVAAPDLAAQTSLDRPTVYTFAGPRAGNPIFAGFYDDAVADSWRVVNTNDEVPKLPGVVTIVIGPPPEFRRHTFFYDHVDSEYDITFGGPIHSIDDVIFNHSSCNYYSTLCDRTSNPAQCKQAGQGLDGCNFS